MRIARSDGVFGRIRASRDPQDDDLARFRHRVAFAIGTVLLAFALLAVRFVFLQVIQHEYYTTRAESNRISITPIPPTRGIIEDRNGVILARNYSAFTLEITPSMVRDIDRTIESLEELIEITPKDKRRFRKLSEDSKPFESLPIRTRLSDEEVARFVAHRYRFPGVEVRARLFRQYPLGAVAVHAVGYINRVSKPDLKLIEEKDQTSNYKGTEHIGKDGLEKSYEFQLHGEAGYEKLEADRFGQPVRNLSRTAPVSGNKLTLTLDIRLQEIAEKAFGDRRGALVAIEPSSGGILALVSMPTFDPNLFVDGIRSEDWDMLNNSPDRPMLNRAINGTYPIGSTFKPFMALAGLETGKRNTKSTIFDPGTFTLGKHVFRDDKPGGHGMVDMHKSIVQSCDTYYYLLANDLGIEAIARFMKPIGFGSRTGIDIDGESEGVLPSPEWKKRRFKQPLQQQWFGGDTISIGIGQGYTAYTPLQLAQATATLANDGVLFRPHLVRYITDSRTGERTMIEPEPLRALSWKQQNIDFIKQAMIGVNQEGTGARAFARAEYISAGKTGTAQVFSLKGGDYKEDKLKQELRDHSFFIAFAPADKPRIALAVLVENGGFGSQSAAPIARRVLDHYLLGRSLEGPAKEDTEATEGESDPGIRKGREEIEDEEDEVKDAKEGKEDEE